MKTFVNNKFNLTKNMNYAPRRLENIVGKGENAGHQHFLLFSQCFKMTFPGSLKVWIVLQKVNFMIRNCIILYN